LACSGNTLVLSVPSEVPEGAAGFGSLSKSRLGQVPNGCPECRGGVGPYGGGGAEIAVGIAIGGVGLEAKSTEGGASSKILDSADGHRRLSKHQKICKNGNQATHEKG